MKNKLFFFAAIVAFAGCAHSGVLGIHQIVPRDSTEALKVILNDEEIWIDKQVIISDIDILHLEVYPAASVTKEGGGAADDLASVTIELDKVKLQKIIKEKGELEQRSFVVILNERAVLKVNGLKNLPESFSIPQTGLTIEEATKLRLKFYGDKKRLEK